MQPKGSQPLAVIHSTPGATPVAARDRAHRVRPVADVVARLARARLRRVPPVVVVGERPVVVVAAVVADERGMGEIDAGVDRADDDAGAGVAAFPDLIGADLRDTPLRVASGLEHRDGGLHGLDQRVDLRRVDRADALELRQPGHELRVTGHEQGIPEPVALRVRALGSLGDRQGFGLGRLGRCLEMGDDEADPPAMLLDLGRAPEVRASRELDDESCRARLQELLECWVDGHRASGRWIRSQGRSGLTDGEDERGDEHGRTTDHRRSPSGRRGRGGSLLVM